MRCISPAALASLQIRSNLSDCSTPALSLLCVNDASFLGHRVVKKTSLKKPECVSLSACCHCSWALLWPKPKFLSVSQDLLYCCFTSSGLSSGRDWLFHPAIALYAFSNIANERAFLLELPFFSHYYHPIQASKKLFSIICLLVNALPDSKSFDQDSYTVYISSLRYF